MEDISRVDEQALRTRGTRRYNAYRKGEGDRDRDLNLNLNLGLFIAHNETAAEGAYRDKVI